MWTFSGWLNLKNSTGVIIIGSITNIFFVESETKGLCVSLYHPQHPIDGEDRGHPSKRQPLEDTAVGVRAVASLSGAVILPKLVQEAQNIQLHSSPLHRGRARHKQLRVRHQRWTIPEGENRDK